MLSPKKFLVFQYAGNAVFAAFVGWRYTGGTRSRQKPRLCATSFATSLITQDKKMIVAPISMA